MSTHQGKQQRQTLLRKPHSWPIQLLIALVFVGAATLLTLWVRPSAPQFTYGFYYAAVLLATLYSGLGAGIIAIVLGMLAGDYFLVLPVGRALSTSEELLHALSFVVIAALICALIYLLTRSAAKLRERERFIENLAATAPYLLYLYDVPNERIAYVTPGAEEHGEGGQRARPAASSMSLVALPQAMEPLDQVRYSQHVSDLAALPSGSVLVFEQRIRLPDGEWRWCERQEQVYDRLEGGAIHHVLGVAQDITARKAAEERARYQAQLLDSVEQAVIAIDMNNRVTYWNKFAETMYGWSASEVQGKTITGLLSPPTVRTQADEIMTRLRSGQSWSGEIQLQRRDGSTFFADVIDAPIYDENGDLAGIMGVSVDITQRKRAETYLQFLADASLELSSSLDYKTTIQRVADLTVPRLADWCSVDLVRADEALELVAVAHVDPNKVRWARELRRQYPPTLEGDAGIAKVIKTGASEFYPEITQAMIEQATQDEEQLAILRKIGMCSLITVPLRVRGRIIGALTLVWSESNRHYSTPDLVFAEELASRAAIAVDNALLYQELQISEDRFRSTFEQAAVGISHVALDGRWLRVNNRLCEITGYSREDLLQMTFRDITHPDDMEPDLDFVRRTIAGELDGYRLEKRYLRKDGALIWVQLTVSLVRDAQTRDPQYFISVVEDITLRKATETQLLLLAESSNVLSPSLVDERALQSAANLLAPRLADWCVINLRNESTGAIEPVAIAHRDLDKVAVLRSLAANHPVSPQQETGTPAVIRTGAAYFLPHVGAEDLKSDSQLALLQAAGIASIMIVPMRARGHVIGAITLARIDEWHLYTENDLRFAEELAQRIALAIDNANLYLSARNAEAQLRQLNESLEDRVAERTQELERSNRELDRFAYIASHDLKAPLRAIDNLSTWLHQDISDILPASSQEHLQKLRGRVRRMERLLDDLLAYSRAGRVQHALQEVDSGVLVRSIFELLSPPPDFRLTAYEPMPVIYTQRVPLETVLRNLLGNAIKHHDRPDGHVQVTARWLEGADTIEFSVQDDGPGMAHEYHERIFELFQTLQPRDQVEGSGMGLAIVKKTVESVGGSISVESTEGEGTCFRFTWPVKQPESQPVVN
jgi:PAS domain S-box-containing protein